LAESGISTRAGVLYSRMTAPAGHVLPIMFCGDSTAPAAR
jgi:hypothetical protein